MVISKHIQLRIAIFCFSTFLVQHPRVYNNYAINKKDTLDALKNYPDKSIDLLYDAKFKPECCPNSFSNSSGCACMTTEQFNYLTLRGGNNTPYSEY